MLITCTPHIPYPDPEESRPVVNSEPSPVPQQCAESTHLDLYNKARFCQNDIIKALTCFAAGVKGKVVKCVTVNLLLRHFRISDVVEIVC